MIKQAVLLLLHSKKIWIIPALLLVIIIAMVIVGAQISPVPLFFYPIL